MGAWVWWHQCSTNRRTELTKIRKYKHASRREHFISRQQTRQHKCNREMCGAKCEKEKSFEIPIIPFYIKNNSLNRAKYWKITAMYFLRLKTWHKLMCWRVKEKRIAFFMAYAPRSTQMKRIKSVRALEMGMICTIAFCVLLCERNTFSTVTAWCMDCWVVHWTSLGNDIQFDNDDDDEDDGGDGERRDDGFFALHKTHLHSFVSLILILFIFSYSDLRCSNFAWLFFLLLFHRDCLWFMFLVQKGTQNSELTRVIPDTQQQRTSNLHFLFIHFDCDYRPSFICTCRFCCSFFW